MIHKKLYTGRKAQIYERVTELAQQRSADNIGSPEWEKCIIDTLTQQELMEIDNIQAGMDSESSFLSAFFKWYEQD